jgi:hypothetical protein
MSIHGREGYVIKTVYFVLLKVLPVGVELIYGKAALTSGS